VSTLSREGNASGQFSSELDRRFRAPLLAYFMRKVRDRSEAEDLTQEVFLRLSRQSEPPQAVQAYVFVTAANLLKDRARVRITHRVAAHDSLDDLHSEASAVPGLVEDRNPERVLVGKDTLREFISVLETLSERTRDIFILARIERMSQRDIAKLFGISVSAVEKHLAKALIQLGVRFSGQ
jgi:RNA polymerase sigma-70 factor (ECF subfamily)